MSFEAPLALDISNYFPKIKLLNIFYIFVMLSFANRFRPLLINFFVLLIVIILFFAALEILLNFVPYTPSFFKPNSAQVHKTCDFNVTYKINNYGFRDKDFNFKNIEQSFNIVLVGDSMIMGHGIHEHETIARIMEKKLRLKKPKTHVFNLGLSSANPDMYFQVIDSVASKLSPDILILMYYTGNDVHEMSTGVINSESLKSVIRGIRFFIPKTLSFFKKRLSSFILSGHFAKKDEFLGTDCKPLEKKIEEIRKENNDFIFLNNQKYEAAIKRTKQDFLILKKLFEKQGIPFYVVVLDSYIQNQPQFWEIYAKAEKGSTWFQNNKGPYRKNHDWLIDLKNKTGLRLVFTLDKFWNHEGVPLFIPHDGHINAAGAVKVSEVIMEAISGSMNLDAVEF